jgi:hypothetical protein
MRFFRMDERAALSAAGAGTLLPGRWRRACAGHWPIA